MEFISKYWTELDVRTFGKMLSNKRNSHKFYFFPVLVDAISAEKNTITYSEVAERMIAEAWYPVLEHHIHLGQYKDKVPNDSIERAVIDLQKKLQVETDISVKELINKLHELEKEERLFVTSCKEEILRYVPTRLLSPFLDAVEADYQKEERIFQKIFEANDKAALPYVIDRNVNNTLDRKIIFDKEWSKFIKDNYVEIRGWINNERLTYLQKRNPQMPGLVFKMKPMKRKREDLEAVRNLWKIVIQQKTMLDVFEKKAIAIEDFEVDHFIPWSYVACDELWNLSPIRKTVNLDKRNYLPPEEYIPDFVRIQKEMYELVLVEKKRKKADIGYHSELLEAFEKCEDKNLWAVWAYEELYVYDTVSFEDVLTQNIKNLYDSAKNQGYDEWVMHKDRW